MEVVSLLVISIIVLALLGVIIAFSPTLILTEIAILTRSKKPFVHTFFLIAGIAASVTIFALITFFFIDPDRTIQLPSTRQVLQLIPFVDILIGIILVVVGLRLLRPASAEPEKKKALANYTLTSKTIFFIGLVKMSTSLSSLAAILFASQFIKTYFSGGSAQFVALIWLICISLLPFVLLIGAKQYRPQMFSKIQNASDKVSTLNWRRIVAGTILLASICFMVVGLKNL